MKKLNNKGIGHHLLLLVVAVMAVVGASGYFVWQRQQNSNIDAKAAGYTYQGVAGPGFGAKYSRGTVVYMACATKLKSGYQINMYFRTDFSGPGKGQIKINGSVVHSFTAAAKSTTLSSKTLSNVTKLEFAGEYYDDYRGMQSLQGNTINVVDLISCNKVAETSKYKYETVAYNSDLTVQYFACKVKVGSDWRLETKLLSNYLTNAYSVDPNKSINDSSRTYAYSYNAEFGPGIVSYGVPSPVLKKGSIILFGAEYILEKYDLGTEKTLQGATKTIDTVANCI